MARERSGARVAAAAPAGDGGRGGSALRAGGWGPGWGVVGQPVPGCVCNQHLSAHRQRRPRGAREPGRGQEQPEENNNRASPHAGGRLVAARGAPNFISAKVRGSQPGLGCRGGGAWGAGAGEEGTRSQPSVDLLNVSCASVTGNSSPVARSSGELGFGCSGPADRCPLTPHPNQMRGE